MFLFNFLFCFFSFFSCSFLSFLFFRRALVFAAKFAKNNPGKFCRNATNFAEDQNSAEFGKEFSRDNFETEEEWKESQEECKDSRNLKISKNGKRLKIDQRRNETIESWKQEIDGKNRRIVQLEEEMTSLRKILKENSGVCNYQHSNEFKYLIKEDKESWRKEIDTKNRRIVELEEEVASLENFLREHTDTESIRDLEISLDRKRMRIAELEDTIAEFEDFLKQNPDVKELHDLRRQVAIGNRRIQELEKWIEKNGDGSRDVGFDQDRVMELEEMVTQLEEYVREHNIDVLKQKLQDRECRIDQLQGRVDSLEKELLKLESKNDGKKKSGDKETNSDSSVNEKSSSNEIINLEITSLRSTDEKFKEMENTIYEKDNKIQEYEEEIVRLKDEVTKMSEEISSLEKELTEYEAEDIGVLKEEIRVRDEKVIQLEDEIDSLERAFSERIDLEQIEELVNTVKEKESRQRQLEKDIEVKKERIEELSEALRESVIIATDSERKFQQEESLKKSALDRVAKLEQRMASMQTASALNCTTCKPLLSKLEKTERKLRKLCDERTSQMEDLYQMKREALESAVSEKDAHLALLELSGIKTAAQAEQAEKLKADKKRLLERLKKEDERSIEFSTDVNSENSDEMPQLLTQVLEMSDEDDLENKTIEDRLSETDSPRPATTNGDTCNYTIPTTSTRSNRDEQLEIQRQESR